ncbi:MAG: hypothetical protein HY903_24595 [Deltaproteobacteria bacterium]|nr:hypothetical protein [Deltaproteobacteria bacterium]
MPKTAFLCLAALATAACAPERSNPLDPAGALRALPNRPPVLTELAPPVIAEGETLVLVVAAVDPDGDPVSLSAGALPPGASFTLGVLRFSPDYTGAGTYVVTFTATDPQGLSRSITVNLVVADETAAGCRDRDGDGHLGLDALACPAGVDCDDTSPAVHPGAIEARCNRIDDDCDPTSADDPDPTDADGDGSTAGCGDCADGDAAVHPGALESACNAKDDDCDRATADNPDRDGDLFGICADCDDADSSIHPRAARVCDGGDHDCDGVSDVGCI